MKRLIFNLIGAALLTSLFAANVTGADNAATFVVAPDGNDAHAGTTAKPFATLTRARDAARQLGTNQARRIVVRGGKYYNVTLELGPQDSGLTIEAAPGETPALYGGRLVSGWEKDGDRFYAAKLPGVKERKVDFRVLLVNDQLRPRARLPHTGDFTHLSRFDAPWHTTVGGGFRGADTPELKSIMQYRQGDLGPGLDINNAELTIYHQWDDSVVGLKAHDPETQTLRFSTPSGYPPGAFGVRTYVVWNIREGMFEPGQWYLDRTGGRVVYWPKPGEDIRTIEVIAPSAESVIDLNGTKETPVSGVKVEGLSLYATTTPLLSGGWAAGVFKGAVESRFTRDCVFRRLHVSGVGGQAIRMADGMNNTVAQCEMASVGAGGIYDIRGNGNRILGNRIRQFGMAYASAIGIRTPGGGQKQPEMSHDNEIANNEVSGGPYVGIEFDGWRNRFERNLVYDVMRVLRDGAAFYGGGKENVLRGNVVRELPSGKHANAYYIDELGEGFLVESNLSINCEWPVHMHMAVRNTIRNNVFVNKGAIRLTFPRSSDFTMDRNIVVAGGPIRVENPSGVATWTNNLFSSQSGQYPGVPETVQKGDPRFVDLIRMDYRFEADSPATALGIKPLGFGDVGPRPETRSDIDQK
jgi:hypothetical protein